MERALELNSDNILNKYVEPYLFPIISAIVLLLIGLIVMNLNSAFMNSHTVTCSAVLTLGSIWILMLWINYGEMTLKTVLQIGMAIVFMITVYFFIMFELAGKNCRQDMAI